MSNLEYYPVLSYINEKLKISIFSKYNNRSYLLFEKMLYEGDVSTFTSEIKLKKSSEYINELLEKYEKKYSIRFSKIIPIIETNTYYTESKKFVSSFKEEHVFSQSDIDKITKKAVSLELENPMYVIGGYMIDSVKIDDIRQDKAINNSGKKITLYGELVIIDSDTFYPIDKIISFSKYTNDNFMVTSYMYKYLDFLENRDVLIEYKSDRTKFSVKNNNTFQNFSIPVGIGHIFQNTYMELSKVYDAKESEKALRFLQDNFSLKIEEFDIYITENITLNRIIEIFTINLDEYLKMFDIQLEKNNIQINNIYCKYSVYNIDEWVNYIKENSELSIAKFKIPKYNNTQKENLITHYCIEQIDKTKSY